MMLVMAGAIAGAEPRIWPVAGLYGVDLSACGTEDRERLADVDPAFCGLLSVEERQRIGAEFVRLVQGRFPNVTTTFAGHLPASATARAKLNSTLVASLRLTRASIWKVQRGAGIDGYLPLTLTLDITNGATGEVLFSRTRTDVGQGTYEAAAAQSALAAELPRHLRKTLSALVDSAAREWKPYAQHAKVIGKSGDYWVLDVGRANGIRPGDTLGQDAQVIHSASNYALVKPVLGTLQEGQILSRTVASSAAMMERPTVLALALEAPNGQAQYLAQVFGDAVASKSGFAAVPVNPAFSSLRTHAIGQAEQRAEDSRSLPDYIAAFSVVPLEPAIFSSNIPGVQIARYEAHAFVDLIDNSGRIVFTARGTGAVEDKVAGVSFEKGQRQDTVVRNALIDAAVKLAKFKPQPQELAVTPAGNYILIRDVGGIVPLGAQLTVLRPAGTVRGMKIKVPVGEITTSEYRDGGLLAGNSGASALQIKAGDVIALESDGRPLRSRAPVLRCRNQQAASLDDRGSVPFPLFASAADSLFASQFGGPVHLAELATKLQFVRPAFGASWTRFHAAKPVNSITCFTPVIAVTTAADARGKQQRQLTIGYTLFRNGQKVGGTGLQSSFVPTLLPPDTDPAVAQAMLQHDLATIAVPLAEKASGQLKPN